MSDRCEYCYGCTCPGDCSGAHLAAKDREIAALRTRLTAAEGLLATTAKLMGQLDVALRGAPVAARVVDEMAAEIREFLRGRK